MRSDKRARSPFIYVTLAVSSLLLAACGPGGPSAECNEILGKFAQCQPERQIPGGFQCSEKALLHHDQIVSADCSQINDPSSVWNLRMGKADIDLSCYPPQVPCQSGQGNSWLGWSACCDPNEQQFAHDPFGFDNHYNPNGWDFAGNENMWHPHNNPNGWHPEYNQNGFHPEFHPAGWDPMHNPQGFHAEGYHPFEQNPEWYHPGMNVGFEPHWTGGNPEWAGMGNPEYQHSPYGPAWNVNGFQPWEKKMCPGGQRVCPPEGRPYLTECIPKGMAWNGQPFFVCGPSEWGDPWGGGQKQYCGDGVSYCPPPGKPMLRYCHRKQYNSFNGYNNSPFMQVNQQSFGSFVCRPMPPEQGMWGQQGQQEIPWI